jgi:predicted ATP-dependent endonuclease of OLD family
MSVYVVVEGPTDQAILEAVLRKENGRLPMTFVVGGSWSSAESLARSLLMVRDKPVALVVDADTADEPFVQERRDFLLQSLGEVAPSARWRVCLFVPTIEILFFVDPDLELPLFGKKLSAEDRIEARFRPKAVLERVLRERKLSFDELLKRFRQADLMHLQDTPPLPELREFVEQHAATAGK